MSDFDFMQYKPEAPKPEPVLSARQQHDKVISWRNGWVADPRAASYFWAAYRDGTLLMREYDPCEPLSCSSDDADPEAHLHRLAELPGAWRQIIIGKAKSFDRDHNEIEVPVGVPVFQATVPFNPFQLRAIPVTLSHQSLAERSIDVGEGMCIVWGHRTISNTEAGGTHVADSLVLGLVDGTKFTGSITQAFATGEVTSHESLDEAFALLHPALLPKT